MFTLTSQAEIALGSHVVQPLTDDTRQEDLVECSHCGLVQLAEVTASAALFCGRCGSRVGGGPGTIPGLAVVCAGASALLLGVALSEPVFELHLLGRDAAAGVMTGPRMLVHRGMPELAVVVLGTMLVMPALQVVIFAIALLGSRFREPQRGWFLPLGLLETARLWSMADVFLLGALVCHVRLDAWANVRIGNAVVALLALILVTLATEHALDVRGLWGRVPWNAPLAKTGTQIGCSWCGLVNHAQDGAECARCGRTLHARKRNSLSRTGALLLAATFLSIPANVVPVMDMIQFGRPETNTIFSGVLELIHNDLWGLAAIIFVASIVIPALKIVALAILLLMTARGRADFLRGRTWTFRMVKLAGRWSLVDVFAVTILVSLVHMGVLASVLPRYGAVAFCAVVLLTMLAAETFDPRLMWDAAGLNSRGLQREL